MKDRTDEIARNREYNGYQKALASMVYKGFKDNIWAANLAEIESLFSKYKNVKCLLCVTGVFTKYV